VPISYDTAQLTLAVNPDANVRCALASSSTPVGPIRERHGLHHTRDQPRKRDRVAADVEDAAAAERRTEQPMRGMPGRAKPEVRPCVANRSDGPIAEPRQQFAEQRMAAIHERLHQEHPLPPGCGHHSDGAAFVERERLLAQHVAAGRDGCQRLLLVQRMRCGDVNRVDPAARQQRRQPVRPRGDAEPPGERARFVGGGAGDVDDLAAR